MPGVSLTPVTFTPRAPGDGKYADTTVRGIRLRVEDRRRYDPTAMAVHLLAAIRTAHPDRFAFLAANFDRLAGTPALRQAIEAGQPAAAIVAGWTRDPLLQRFRASRAEVILYPE
jgi:uncharacterized protein YbbC (DUF1343 family)